MAVYDRIKTACKERGLSVNGLEQRLGLERSTLYKMNAHMPSADKLMRIARELDKPIEYFLESNEGEKEDK